LSDIVGKQGEKDFHHCENQILTAQLSKHNIVLTTDASVVDDEKNRKLLSSEFVVYLKVSTPIQLERLSRNSEELLPIIDLKSFLNKLHDERDDMYEQVSSLTISSDNSALESHVQSIVKVVIGDEMSAKNSTLNKNDLIFFHKSLHTPVKLIEQQASCLKLLSQGKSSKQIAQDLDISYRTVEDYLAKAMDQLGCASSKELIALYHDQP
jgi:shikimate kinase